MTQITEDYVSFEVAKLLKEKGFSSEDCLAFYNEKGDIGFLQTFGDMSEYLCDNSCIDAPTLQMAMKWLREIHKYHIVVEKGDYGYFPDVESTINESTEIHHIGVSNDATYEYAVEAAIRFCLENLIK